MGEGCEPIKPQLSDYLDHLLTAPEMEAIEHHLGDCPECFAYLAELRHVQTSLQNLPVIEPPDTFYQRVLAKVQEPAVEQESVRPKAPWSSMLSYKTAGAFAILALVLVATREKRKAYLHLQQSAEQFTAHAPVPIPAPPALRKEAAGASKAAAFGSPQSMPKGVAAASTPASPPTDKLRQISAPVKVETSAKALRTGQLANRKTAPLSMDRATSPAIPSNEPTSLYSALQEQFLGRKSAASKPAVSDKRDQLSAQPVLVVASLPAPINPPVASPAAATIPVAPTRATVPKKAKVASAPSVVSGSGAVAAASTNAVLAETPASGSSQISEASARSTPKTPATPALKPATVEATEDEKDVSAALPAEHAQNELSQERAAVDGSAPSEETPSSEGSNESKPVEKKVRNVAASKGFHDPQLKGQPPADWDIHVVRTQPQLDRLIASLPDTENGDLKEIGTAFDTDMLLVLVPHSSDGQAPIIESQVPDVFPDRVDIFYLELPSSQNNPPVVTCISLPKTQLPIIFKRVTVEP